MRVANVVDWMREQFTPARIIRWMDGANPKRSYGNRSFIQAHEYDYVYDKKKRRGYHALAPHLWSVVQVGIDGGARSSVYTKVYFFQLQGGGYKAEVEIWSCGVRYTIPRRSLTSDVVFDRVENAPKKLNREIRRLRALLFDTGKTTV